MLFSCVISDQGKILSSSEEFSKLRSIQEVNKTAAQKLKSLFSRIVNKSSSHYHEEFYCDDMAYQVYADRLSQLDSPEFVVTFYDPENTDSDIQEVKSKQQDAKFLALGELAAGIGHEINNPLSIIHGNLDLLEAKLTDVQNSDEIKSLISKIKTSSTRIKYISNGLRRLVRDDAMQEHSKLDLFTVVDSTVSLLKEIYAKQDISLTFEGKSNAHVIGLFSELQQVILNLISNAKDAVEKQPGKKSIALTLSSSESQFKVTVKDSGKGISASKQQMIFDSLYTEKPSGKGTGLGLGICKRIILEHHGQLDVNSNLGEGATFIITLPKSTDCPPREDSAATQDQQSPNKSSEREILQDETEKRLNLKKVLVVDDEPMILEIVSAFLEQKSIDSFCTTKVDQALIAAKTGAYDLILTDLCMPEQGGIALLDNLSSEDLSIPVVVMTGGVFDESMLDKYSTLVKAYVHKPFSEKKLMQTLNEACASEC